MHLSFIHLPIHSFILTFAHSFASFHRYNLSMALFFYPVHAFRHTVSVGPLGLKCLASDRIEFRRVFISDLGPNTRSDLSARTQTNLMKKNYIKRFISQKSGATLGCGNVWPLTLLRSVKHCYCLHARGFRTNIGTVV